MSDGLAGRPDVTALIVRWRDDPRLAACLDALKRQEGVSIDVILVENEARNDAVEPWKAPGGAVRRLDSIRRQANPGFAGSFNEAWDRARTDSVLSVNPDCRLDPGAVRAALSALAADPAAGAVAFRLLRPGRVVLDSAGIVLSRLLWRAHDRGRGLPEAGRYATSSRVDAACLAGALLRRDAVDRARDGAGDVLDARYFAYQEDVDLGWRLRRAGYHILYEPAAVGEHDRGWREGARRRIPVNLRRFSLRNRWFTILKNATGPGLLARLPLLLLGEAAFAAKLLVSEPAVLSAFGMAIRGARASIGRRGRWRDRQD